MKVGARVKEILFKQKRSAKWLADQIPCERTNVYDIFKRDDMNVQLLMKISRILAHDFFEEISKELFPKK